MSTDKKIRWLAFAALIMALLSLSMDSDGHSLIAATVIMGACVVLTYSQRQIKEER